MINVTVLQKVMAFTLSFILISDRFRRVPSPILLYIVNADGSHQKVETPAKLHRRQPREKRREIRAKELVQQNDDTILKLENAAIERSKSVDSAVLGKYSIWRRENENDNSDSNNAHCFEPIIGFVITCSYCFNLLEEVRIIISYKT